MIKTRWHHALELMGAGKVYIAQGQSAFRLDHVPGLSAVRWASTVFEMAKLPKIVLDQELIDSAPIELVRKSTDAMVEAGVARLPFPEVCVEMVGKHDAYDQHWFFGMTENTKREAIKVPSMFVGLGERTFTPDYAVSTFTIVKDEQGKQGLRARHATYLVNLERVDGNTMAVIRGVTGKHITDLDQIDQPTAKQEASEDHFYVGRAIAYTLLVTNMRGIEKEVIEPTRLNKARALRGQPAIPPHTVLRLGHIYDRKGRSISVNEARRRQMPMHFRKGHTRQQRFGKGLEESKLIYIQPCIVNFDPASEDTPKTPNYVARW